jgi:hypothetical protein
MRHIDLTLVATNGNPFPLTTPDFDFSVSGALVQRVGANGISCGPTATLKLTAPANSLEIDGVSGAPGVILAASTAPPHADSRTIIRSGPYHFIFDFTAIKVIHFVGDELELHFIDLP